MEGPGVVTAIMVDGGFYRCRARTLFGEKSPGERADELVEYCRRHIRQSGSSLYRIFYYDCPPSEKVLFHPLTRQQVNLAKTPEHTWMTEFLGEIVKRRKVALRRGEELETQEGFRLSSRATKELCSGKRSIEDLTIRDFKAEITQKGVDMRLGLDIASLAHRHLVNQIIMISGDSDFVPAAKHARREGIDFILDPMWARVSASLNEHIDGLRECVSRPPRNLDDPLHASNSEFNRRTRARDIEEDDEKGKVNDPSEIE